MNNGIDEKLNNLKTEDIIWIIYFFLAILALISNKHEKESLLKTNNTFNSKSKNINITIFIISFFIYLYFVYTNYQDFEKIKKGYINSSNQNILLHQARLIAAILFLIGGIIYLITEYNSSPENEIAII